eukprot:gene16833-22318_t
MSNSSSDPLFQKSLQDLVKGIRSNKKDPSSYISQAIAEIKNELKSTEAFTKTEAVRKLTYLQMIGYNISWASFAIVEVMSQPKFAHKRVGYLAANQSFTETTDVILLTTNLFKKELASSQTLTQYEIGLAINCLANIANKDLARDCITDVIGLRLSFDKVKERLDDTESSVVSCAVNVICELANKNPKNYLALAPKFFRLLTTSSNNWMLIKVVKLMGSLVSEEPRLARKLLDPLVTIIQNTGAKSLQYECIHTITEALPHTKREDGSDAKSVPAVVALCSDYLKKFIEDPDQNLKYLGLVGLVSLLRSHPRNVVDHRDVILKCLNDDDTTIRVRALELLAGIVSRKSLVDLVHHLLEHAKRAEGYYRDEIISKVLYMCGKDKFALVTDFSWYLSILLDLAVMQGSKHGKEVADQIIDMSLRVDTVRPYAVESMLSLLLNEKLILGLARQTVSEVLKAAAWVVGEYSSIVTSIASDTAEDYEVEADENLGYWIEGPSGEDIRSQWRGQEVHLQVIDALLSPRATNLPSHVQCVYIQAAMKVFIRACCDREEAEVASIIGILRSRLNIYLQSQHIEVQERASTLRHILSEFNILSLTWQDSIKSNEEEKVDSRNQVSSLLDLLEIPTATSLTAKPIDEDGAKQAKLKANVLLAAIIEPFYAVHSKAQKKVPVPEGLDLKKPIKESALNKLLQVEIPENLTLSNLTFVPVYVSQLNDINTNSTSNSSHHQEEENKHIGNITINQSTRINTNNNPTNATDENLFYLSNNNTTNKNNNVIPLSQMLIDSFEDKKSKKKNKKDDKKKVNKNIEIDTREMLPAGALSSDDNKKSKKNKDKDISITRRKGHEDEVDLDNIDITTPLREDEGFVILKHREVNNQKSTDIAKLVNSSNTANTIVDEKKDKKKSKKEKKDRNEKEKEKEKIEKVDKINAVSSSLSNILAFDSSDIVESKEKESKKSKKSNSKSSKVVAVDDLLNFDWNSNTTNQSSNQTSSQVNETSHDEVKSSNQTVDFPVELVPNKLTENDFSQLVSKSSSRWANASIKINFTSKFKSVVKAIALFIHASIIEVEYSRAVSLCAKTSTGGSICCLIKWVKDSLTLNIDIKCLCASKPESTIVAESIAQALSDIKL